jgi:hypothetical protein
MNEKVYNLEELSNHLIDNWTAGNYTGGYNGEEAMLSGRQMSEIFIQQARKYFPGEPQREVMWYAEQLEDWIEEGINHLQSKHA